MKSNLNLAIGVGRRKTAVARVYLRNGNGNIKVNGKDVKEYFALSSLAMQLERPFNVTDTLGKYDLVITVRGGGINGQAGACRHGIARALTVYDESNRSSLKANGLLRRDSRMVERKKYGQKGARRRFQFSKR
ncbi:MAG: 30S ribosomal protein S9 [Spirochaetaceae bacterium]|nr:30S ribosomal protein S9 [Spirochaetaceae bacterium]